MYDLSDLRAGLQQFIEGIGWRAVLAEHSSFSVDTSKTTIENSLRNVRENSDIFVMVVGARYGSIDPDSDKSVTNLEFLEARSSGVPVYVFVDSGVLAQLRVWHDNPEADFSSVVDTARVFEFIDSFYRSGGVWTFPFSTAGEIVDTLRTQFAYLVRDALEVRKITGQREETTEAASVEPTEVRHQRASRQQRMSGLITATLAAGHNRYTFEGVAVTPHQDSRYRYLDVRKQGISPAEYASLCRALADPNTPTDWDIALSIGGRTFNLENCQVTPNAPDGGDYYVDVRAHTDESEHRQVLEALAETTTHTA